MKVECSSGIVTKPNGTMSSTNQVAAQDQVVLSPAEMKTQLIEALTVQTGSISGKMSRFQSETFLRNNIANLETFETLLSMIIDESLSSKQVTDIKAA